MTLKPGKGAHLDLTEEVIVWISQVIQEAELKYQSEDGDALQDNGKGLELLKEFERLGWEREDDKFGKKAYRQLPWQEGAIRITVVLGKQGNLKLDVRYWYDE